MNRKYVIAAIAAGATIAGCGWYFFKASQRKAAEMQAQLQHALSLAKDGNFADCTALLQAAVLEMQQFYGPDDPAAIHAVSILAGVLHRQNNLAEAETLMRDCAAGLDRTVGEDHFQQMSVLSPPQSPPRAFFPSQLSEEAIASFTIDLPPIDQSCMSPQLAAGAAQIRTRFMTASSDAQNLMRTMRSDWMQWHLLPVIYSGKFFVPVRHCIS